MKDLTLVIMAAGMGSRFGGLKQIEPMGPNGEFLIDYSIYDAIKCGFKKIVFVIKKENYEIFKETVGKRCEGKIKVDYAFQTLEDIPKGYSIPSDRVKPLGTAQAIYAARDLVDGCFAVINSDDFYGREAYSLMSEFLRIDESGLAKELFENVINKGIDEFLELVLTHKNSKLYKEISNIAIKFIEFERFCFELNKPLKSHTKKVQNDLSRSEFLRREANKQRRNREKSQRIS